jgi:hypothetical protein
VEIYEASEDLPELGNREEYLTPRAKLNLLPTYLCKLLSTWNNFNHEEINFL